MKFPDLGVIKKVVDNVKNYQNMQYEENPFATFGENSQKPQKMELLIKKNWGPNSKIGPCGVSYILTM